MVPGQRGDRVPRLHPEPPEGMGQLRRALVRIFPGLTVQVSVRVPGLDDRGLREVAPRALEQMRVSVSGKSIMRPEVMGAPLSLRPSFDSSRRYSSTIRACPRPDPFRPPPSSSFSRSWLRSRASCRRAPSRATRAPTTPRCCSDKTSHLVCTGSKLVLETCKGQGGCTDDKSLICDNAKADVGDGCKARRRARACSGGSGPRSCAAAGASLRSSGTAAAAARSTR